MSNTGRDDLTRHWFKSSFSRSSNNCVEVSFGWTKSTFSRDTSNCVEVRFDNTEVLVRDSKYAGPPADQPMIAVPTDLWPRLLEAALSKTSTTLDALSLTIHPSGSATLTNTTTELHYTPTEWDAFAKGIADGQFTRPGSPK